MESGHIFWFNYIQLFKRTKLQNPRSHLQPTKIGWSCLIIFERMQAAEMSAAHKAFWLPLSQQSDTASDLGLIHLYPSVTRFQQRCWRSQGGEEIAEIDGTCLLSGLQNANYTWPPWTPCWQCFRVANAANVSDALILCIGTPGRRQTMFASDVNDHCESQVAWTGRSRQTRKWYSWCWWHRPWAPEHQHCHSLPRLSHLMP